MALPNRNKTDEEIERFYESRTIGYTEKGHRIMDCTYEELVEGIGAYTPDEIENMMFEAMENGLKRYHEVHIPPFTIYRTPHGKFGLLNKNGYPCGKAKYTYCLKAGYEDYLQDENGTIYEFDPNEGLIPISKEDRHKILNR